MRISPINCVITQSPKSQNNSLMRPFSLQKHTSGRFLCLGSFGYGFTALLRLSLQRAECDSKQKVAAEKRVQRGTTLSDQATTDEQRRAALLLSQRNKRKTPLDASSVNCNASPQHNGLKTCRRASQFDRRNNTVAAALGIAIRL